MESVIYTDLQIEEFLKEKKLVKNPKARWSEQRRSKRRNFDIVSIDGRRHYTLYIRQNMLLPENFSCGLRIEIPGKEPLTLIRYNGCDHPHENPLEGEDVSFHCHIHRATERYMELGKKPEHYASVTDRYTCCEGALRCLLSDCNIAGIQPPEIDATRDMFYDDEP